MTTIKITAADRTDLTDPQELSSLIEVVVEKSMGMAMKEVQAVRLEEAQELLSLAEEKRNMTTDTKVAHQIVQPEGLHGL